MVSPTPTHSFDRGIYIELILCIYVCEINFSNYCITESAKQNKYTITVPNP